MDIFVENELTMGAFTRPRVVTSYTFHMNRPPSGSSIYRVRISAWRYDQEPVTAIDVVA